MERHGHAYSQADANAERTRPPLTDAELARIPRASSADLAGLSSTAKRVYAKRREYSRGGELSWAQTTTIAKALGTHEDTIQRADRELAAKGYLEPTGRRRGRGVEYRLLRGDAEVYELRREPLEQPQDAALAPQNAAYTEGARKSESSPERRASSRSQDAAASPSPAKAGKAAAKNEPAPKVTGFRLIRTHLGGDSWIRDETGTDRPSRQKVAEIEEAERRERIREKEREERLAWEAQWPEPDPDRVARVRALTARYSTIGELPYEASAEGTCSDCSADTGLVRVGQFDVCRSCASRRFKASQAFAAQVAAAAESACRTLDPESRL